MKNLNRQIRIAFIATSLMVPATSMAVTFGAGASSSTLTCASFSSTCSVGTSPGGDGPYVDSPGSNSADSSINDIRGSAEAHVTMSGSSGIAMPHLSGQANTGDLAFGTAWGLNTYTYAGSNTTITLDINLTGSVSNPGNSSFTDISANVYIIDPTEIASFNFTDFRGYFNEGIFPLDDTSVSFKSGVTSDSLILDLVDGDTFSIWTIMSLAAGNDGGSVQAMNSLDLTFSDNTGLSSAASAVVPVPAAAWLFGSGLIGLMGVARRRS